MARRRDSSTRIAALREMTVERGSTPMEEAFARRLLDELASDRMEERQSRLVQVKQRAEERRRAKLAYYDSSPARVRRAFEGGLDDCPSCFAKEALQPAAGGSSLGKTDFVCRSCNTEFRPQKSSLFDAWLYRKRVKHRQHRYGDA